jgi:acid phosphatase type 7
MSLNSRRALFATLVGIVGGVFAEPASVVEINGPIVSWHLDPTTTMTVSWIEHSGQRQGGYWQLGRAGFGYGDGDDATLLSQMEGRFCQVYLVKDFDGAAVNGATELGLRIAYDDAFVVYLNGKEILRRGVVGSGKNGKVAKPHEAEGFDYFKLEGWEAAVLPGANILAVEGHNQRLGSSDFTLHPVLVRDGEKGAAIVEERAEWFFFAGEEPGVDWATTLPQPHMTSAAGEAMALPLYWRALGAEEWISATTLTRPFADTGNLIRWVTLDGLKPGTSYEFKLPEEHADRAGKFRTAPADGSTPIRFVTGGDMYHNREFLDAMNVRAGAEDPLFALLGGDLAYDNAKDETRWYDWMDSWHQNAVTPDKFMIPAIVAIGNHETITPGAWSPPNVQPPHSAKYFYSLFLTPEEYKSNYTVDFGNYLSLVILDSNHSQTVVSQTAWLAEQLEKRSTLPALFACYHRPTYGTKVKEDELGIRTQWVPLFEQFGVDAVFENDHHTYKRTRPLLKGDVVTEGGVLYLGDGAWGVGTRKIPESTHDLPYIASAQQKRHLIVVDVSESGIRYTAKEANGNVIDQYP